MNEKQKWFKRLRLVIDDMPDNTEIVIDGNGRIDLHDSGDFIKAFNATGDAQTMNAIPLDSFTHLNVIGNSES